MNRNNNEINAEDNKIVELSDEANQYTLKNKIEVSRTISLLNPFDLKEISKALFETNMIITIAYGANEAVAGDMEMYAAKLTKEGMMLIVSSTGEEEIIASAAEKAKRKGAKIIVLISNYRSQLVQISDYYLLDFQSKLGKGEIYGEAGNILALEVL